jgi:predicted amino acid racemase
MVINSARVLQNARIIADFCGERGIDVWGVTKGLAGAPRLAEIYKEGGFAGVADSRLLNLKKIKDAGVAAPLLLMRIAMRSELEALVETADMSLQSEASTILLIDEICSRKKITRDVLLMMDVGDLREGFWPDEIPQAAAALKNLTGGVRLRGVATNFACASGVLPTAENMTSLVRYRDEFSALLGIDLPIISAGGTCCLKVIEEGNAPREINQLRVCEGVLLGSDTAFDRDIPYLAQDAITITAEIVERKDKPSVPAGETGFQAFGEKPVFEDRGVRTRALLGIGRQDVDIGRITPLEAGVSIVTASSDHLIMDVTEAESSRPAELRFKPGDVLSFRPKYPAMLAAATSEYVEAYFAEGSDG